MSLRQGSSTLSNLADLRQTSNIDVANKAMLRAKNCADSIEIPLQVEIAEDSESFSSKILKDIQLLIVTLMSPGPDEEIVFSQHNGANGAMHVERFIIFRRCFRLPRTTLLSIYLLTVLLTPFGVGQTIWPTKPGATQLSVIPAKPDDGYSAQLTANDGCQVGAKSLTAAPAKVPVGIASGRAVIVNLVSSLSPGDPVCVVESYAPIGAAVGPPPAETTSALMITPSSGSPSAYVSLCHYAFNDCDWAYSVVGGVEQSDLSAQNSQTDPFVDLTVRAPNNVRPGTVWLRARFLGAPTSSSTQNVVAAATNPSGTVTSSSLSTVGYAVDYTIGYEHDWFQPNQQNPTRGMFTLGLVGGFGATTPLNSQSVTVGYAMPTYGTNECNELHQRFTSQNGYNPPLPASGTVTTTTTVGSGAPSVNSPVNYCSILPIPSSSSTTTGGVTVKTSTDNTAITNIAFSPEDRSSFLLKYAVGIRLINRWHSGSSNRCSAAAPNDHTGDGPGDNFVNGPCSRSVVDFTLGQDQAITGGYLRGLVFKSDAIFPIPRTGIYFFASASIRIAPNQNLSPLILTATPVSSGGGTSTPGTVTVPSPSVFVLPLKQSDRDFYRIGIAFDLAKILPKLFSPL